MKSLKLDHITMGVCYYPEHWDRTLWRDDLKRMRAAGIEVIRIAEFAWNKFEPREGEFTFEFFDAFMALALEEGIKVVFCTPTATPPAWMSHKYPEILNADIDGNLIHHGMRRHCNLNSEKYRFFSKRITQKLAEHYSAYPNIVMWQLDNEINCECSKYYSESDHIAFRAWLKERFVTLDAFNAAIGAEFWNQTYTDWEEVYLPRHTNLKDKTNQHMMLLQKRFISDTVIGYFKLQADEIRKYSAAPITTNGLFSYVDYHRLVDEVLDFITYDNYPIFQLNGKLDPKTQNGLYDRNASYKLMRTRGISPVYGIMEQQAGPGGWAIERNWRPPTPKPGQIRLWSMQAIANGADFVSYFRWRTCTFGMEIYWHGILNYDNRDNRRLTEITDTYRDIQKIQDVCGKEYVAEVALLKDYDNEWDQVEDYTGNSLDKISYDSWFVACQKAHVPCDLRYITDDTTLDELKKYKMAVYPHPTILTEKRAALLRAYAEQGGTVVFGCRTGYKDLNGICTMMPMPGHAADLCGATVADFTQFGVTDRPQSVLVDGKSISALFHNDILEVTDGETVGTYENNYYAGEPALVRKTIGKGKVYYFGAAMGKTLVNALLDMERIGMPCGLGEVLEIPETVELAVRGEYVFLLNYTAESVEIPCKATFDELIGGTEVTDALTLRPYGVAVLKRRA